MGEFRAKTLAFKGKVGRSSDLGGSFIDPATLTLTFVYYELVQTDGIWRSVERRQALTVGQHVSVNARAGTITLLDHAFWKTQGRWSAADRIEPLLYKGQIRQPQRIEATHDRYVPETLWKEGATFVTSTGTTISAANQIAVDTTAQTRLGYAVPKYILEVSMPRGKET